jgi:hypothetical protein
MVCCLRISPLIVIRYSSGHGTYVRLEKPLSWRVISPLRHRALACDHPKFQNGILQHWFELNIDPAELWYSGVGVNFRQYSPAMPPDLHHVWKSCCQFHAREHPFFIFSIYWRSSILLPLFVKVMMKNTTKIGVVLVISSLFFIAEITGTDLPCLSWWYT